MKILITGVSEGKINAVLVSGKEPVTGNEYLLEDALEGSSAQNRFFHLLIRIYFKSNLFSDPAKTEGELKRYIMKRLGRGFEKYIYVTDEGTIGEALTAKDIPKKLRHDRERVLGRLWSWSEYTLGQRRTTISNLMNEMVQVNVTNDDFDQIAEEFFQP